MKRTRMVKTIVLLALIVFLSWVPSSYAQGKKGLMLYDSIYGSTVEVVYWIKALIGVDNHLDVKSLSQITTIKPYDYVIFGSLTRNEKPSEQIYEFVEKQPFGLITIRDESAPLTFRLKGENGKCDFILYRLYLKKID